jgi:class 3 adenylate cyclase
VTFLFTDVEGSTRRWEADADAMRKALAAHDEVLRKAIEAHGGFLFKHTGDGVCAAFASPRAAVDAAVAAQRALGLPVRMGIATGEAEFRGTDYFGAVLNRAARHPCTPGSPRHVPPSARTRRTSRHHRRLYVQPPHRRVDP